ncbi:acyl-CoA synthetase (NDP forming) [Corynebacterium mustelae]|uniref:Acyl-CoA synthetase (NDP forming) n=1 Tax=Corynebacterium mustelae TaxID=571915 RepID=A0A0G3H2P5_9CORY|nr:GNAT family N-acetyltransferase [Corynebacterium mustelae]AKK05397.1 acyl-CoA synthetase (NDP forming) [Corynebacterium mustelae]
MPTAPKHWEADVILNDGGIATLRPIRPNDREEIIKFYARVSPKSKYLRFFSTHPTLSDDDLKQWLDIDFHNSVTLVLIEREKIVATARYEVVEQFLPARVADVSFLVQDDHHGRGAGNILLEHLAQIGRECEIERFFAEILTENRSMVQVFIRAGYEVKPELEDGFIVVDFPIEASATSKEVMERRELRAEASSIRRLLNPTSVAIVGDVDDLQRIVPQIVSARFSGQIHIATHDHDSMTAAEHLRTIVGDIDLVVMSHDASHVDDILAAAAEKNAVGVVFLAQGHNPKVSREDTVNFIQQARSYGLRALGPAALGLINTDPNVRLNASPAPMPKRGSIGLFTQSAGVATLTLSHALSRGSGLSSFISAGSFADVTGNDVIQFWADDERTKICLLSLDVVGNPRKFFRVLRRLALEKYVVVFIPSRALKSARHYELEGLTTASPDALDKVIRETGAMVVTRRDGMYDIAQFLARQPVPKGRCITLISNSAGLSEQMRQSAERFGFSPTSITVTGDPLGIIDQTEAALDDPRTDLVFTGIVEINEPVLERAWQGLSTLAAAGTGTPLMATFVGFREFTPSVADEEETFGQLPVYTTYADALEAVSAIVDNERLRAAARPHPDDELGTGDSAQVKEIVAGIVADSPDGRWATDAETSQILSAYGINIVPWQPVNSVDAAIKAAEEYGWNVVLKSVHPVVRGRPELNAVIRHIADADMMRQAWASLTDLAHNLGVADATDDSPAALLPVVQPTVKPGASLTISAIEDPVLGPMISAGIAGISTDLLGDLSWRVPPVRRIDARSMLDGLSAAPLLHGYRGTKPSRLDTLEQVIMKVSQLKDDIASIVEVELNPVIAGIDDTAIVGARLRVAPLAAERDPLTRSL